MSNLIWKIKIILCISAQDGVISETEINTAYRLINDQLGTISTKDFEKIIDEFFDEDYSLEEYLLKIKDSNNFKEILTISYKSAISDGLDIKENLAFDKACKYWGEAIEDYFEE
tara:strand:- start:5148 stop:5489 length:342 start_codon:yes stop_codon:yes gene_type:complete